MTSAWSPSAVAAIVENKVCVTPKIEPGTVPPVLPDFDVWDYWPVQEMDGSTAVIACGALQMLLSAPVLPDPDSRHAVARIRLMLQTSGHWLDLGNLLPDGLNPGSREWSGSAIVTPAHDRITLYYTVAGHQGEAVTSFDQRLFETTASLDVSGGFPKLGHWSAPVESVRADGEIYTREMSGGGAIGTIKAFRDPAWFRDPANSAEYLVFAASLAQSASPWNGAVGLAQRERGKWALRPPLITADGLNNELERPHIVHHGERYYCFWSTQRKVFAADGPSGPTGLYGMVADSMSGTWRPLNGTGLVFANPSDAPLQAYSWLVLKDLSVISFVDRPGLLHEPTDAVVARSHFGGTPAVPEHLILDADRAMLA